MADSIDRYADGKFEEMKRRIRAIYREAAEGIQEKIARFLESHRRTDERMRARLNAGEITDADYQRWLRGQVFQGQRWDAVLDEITRTYVDADKRAREMINEEDRGIFAEAANRTAERIDRNVSGGMSWAIYDQHTVDRLIRDDPQMLPEWRIDEPKDYVWNEQRVRNIITQGILQGQSIQEIGEILTTDLTAQNAGKMQMFARTAVTGAHNAGRVEAMREAEDMGITVMKRWLAVHDSRTRESHAYLDGQTRRPDEDFIDQDGNHIKFPGDPSAPPALTYNCRCTLVYVYPDHSGGG